MAGGFGLCTASTVAAAVSQDILGELVLRHRRDSYGTSGLTSPRDRALLVALLVLAFTGLLTLVFRDTAAFAPLLVIHLGAVTACFAIAPYTKFVHVIYRFLALVHDRSEIGG